MHFCDNEYAPLREVVLCRPKAELRKNKNLDEVGFAYPSFAAKQHAAFTALLEAEGIKCQLMPSLTLTPFQCYMRDSGVSTPWGLLVCRMAAAHRKAEPALLEEFVTANGGKIWKRATQGALEGGDVLLLRPGYVAIGYDNVRTTEYGAMEASLLFREEGWQTRIIHNVSDHGHLDVICSVLDSENILYAESGLSDNDLSWLQEIGYNMIAVPADAAYQMACNVVALGNKRILSSLQGAGASDVLKDLGYTVLTPDLSCFVSDAGGPHCLVFPWRRDPA